MTEKAITDLALVEHLVFGVPAARSPFGHVQRDRALFGEFEGVGEQVLENLLQALGVGVHVARQVDGPISTSNSSFFASATWRKVRST